MELVLSPGAESGPDGPGSGPFRNEDVREWSRLDGVTGMLERARVETGRWRADTQDARHSYGKMVDSRERNSADGSLVQKARRQVEIFQSQGNSGRAFEVIRASQWSSSRATDCATFNIPITKSNENGCIDASGPMTNGIANGASNGTTNGSLSSSGSGSSGEASPRLGNGASWRDQRRMLHQGRGTAGQDLEQLSQLCRRLHDEAISQHNRLWQLAGGTSTSPLSLSEQLAALQGDDFACNGSSPDTQSSRRVSTTTPMPRSSSSEDLSHRSNGTSAERDGEETSGFARDSKARRSLRAPSSSSSSSISDQQQQQQQQRSVVRAVPIVRSELVAERAKRFEPESNGKTTDGASSTNGSSPSPLRRRVNGFVGSFAPIADNDFVKNDPKHPSKIALMQQTGPAIPKIANVKYNADSNGTSAAIALSNGSPITSRKAGEPHRTVVHLRNASSPSGENNCSIAKAPSINGESPAEASIGESSKIQNSKDEVQHQPREQQQVVNSKPVKKVEFCKTEIHFAPDSGRVNIVETDGKPPPTNKFRRRKRNANHHSAQHGTAALPSANSHTRGPLDQALRGFFISHQNKKIPKVCSKSVIHNPGALLASTFFKARSSSLKHPQGKNSTGNFERGNMPLVHFGDTSFEKYFFGGQGKPAAPHQDQMPGNSADGVGKKSGSDLGNSKLENGNAKPNEIDGWQAPPADQLVRSARNGITIETGSNRIIRDADCSSPSRLDHGKARGGHTSTVKILNDESNALHRLAQGVVGGRSLGKIQLQFSAASRSLSPLNFDDDGDLENSDRKSDDGSDRSNESRCSVSHTTKISLQLMPATMAQQLPCIAEPLASLKSVRLVMSIERMSAAGLRSVMLSGLCGAEPKSLISWSQQLGLDGVDRLTDAKVDEEEEERGSKDDDRFTTKSSPRVPMLMDKPHNEDPKHTKAQSVTGILTKQQDSPKSEAMSSTKVPKSPEAASKNTGTKQTTSSNLSAIPANVESVPTAKRTESTDPTTDQAAIAKPETIAPAKSNTIINNDDEEESIPTYENIFDAVSVYENCNLAKSRKSKMASSAKSTEPIPARRRRPASTSKQQQQVASSTGGSIAESNRSVSRSSGGSRDGSIGKAGPVATSRHQQPTAASRRKLVVVKANGSESGQLASSTEKSRTAEATRTKKKPVEVVYQTAVYNMKNEKLSKSNKGKETKGPRLINEFICGSKVKRPSDKKTIKTTTVTQNTGRRKEIPVAVSR